MTGRSYEIGEMEHEEARALKACVDQERAALAAFNACHDATMEAWEAVIVKLAETLTNVDRDVVTREPEAVEMWVQRMIKDTEPGDIIRFGHDKRRGIVVDHHKALEGGYLEARIQSEVNGADSTTFREFQLLVAPSHKVDVLAQDPPQREFMV